MSLPVASLLSGFRPAASGAPAGSAAGPADSARSRVKKLDGGLDFDRLTPSQQTVLQAANLLAATLTIHDKWGAIGALAAGALGAQGEASRDDGMQVVLDGAGVFAGFDDMGKLTSWADCARNVQQAFLLLQAQGEPVPDGEVKVPTQAIAASLARAIVNVSGKHRVAFMLGRVLAEIGKKGKLTERVVNDANFASKGVRALGKSKTLKELGALVKGMGGPLRKGAAAAATAARSADGAVGSAVHIVADKVASAGSTTDAATTGGTADPTTPPTPPTAPPTT